MGKGSKKRKCQVSREVEEANWKAIFGEKKLNVMSNKDREEIWKEFKVDIETEKCFNKLDNIDKIIKEGETQIKTTEHEKFLQTLDNASEIVSKWPEWKQNALGKLRHRKDV